MQKGTQSTRSSVINLVPEQKSYIVQLWSVHLECSFSLMTVESGDVSLQWFAK